MRIQGTKNCVEPGLLVRNTIVIKSDVLFFFFDLFGKDSYYRCRNQQTGSHEKHRDTVNRHFIRRDRHVHETGLLISRFAP